jgi:predicted PurR-regulated permease PerM
MTYAKINAMKANIPQPVHPSYQQHRRDLRWKIILPVALSALLCIALTVLVYFATFQGGGDVERWAAISTIWLAIPAIFILLISLAIHVGLIYLLTKLLSLLPAYTGKAQDISYQIEAKSRQFADAVAKPFIFINSIGASINRILDRL